MGKWVKKKLGDYVVLQGGFAFQSKDFVEDGVPLIRIGDITKEGLCDENAVKLPVNFLDECKEFALNEYDTIIAMSGATTGKCTIVSKKNLPALLNQRVGRFKIKNSSIDKLYLYYIVSSYYYQQKLLLDAIGGAQPNVSPRQIEKVICAFPILLDGSPDFSEQRRIASILSSADKVIDSTQKLIAKYKSIKQGMMEDLLKPKEGWKKVKFDNFFEMLPNNTLSREDLNSQGGSFQNIHYGDVLIKYPYCLDCNIHEIPYINRDVKFNSTKAIDGDIIFADTAEDDTVGKCVELINVGDRKIVSGLHTYLCRPKFKMSVGYLGYFLNSNVYHNQLLPYIAGSKVSSVNRKSIAQTYICFPDLSEQRRIASILSSIDKKIESEEKVLEKYKNIKKGLMEKLLRGE